MKYVYFIIILYGVSKNNMKILNYIVFFRGGNTRRLFLRGTFSEERFLSDSPPNLFSLREPVYGADMGEKGKGEEFMVEYG